MEEKKLIMPEESLDENGVYVGTGRRCEFDIRNEQVVFGGRQVDLLFVGDSITHFMEENQYYHQYGYVVNRGIGGDSAKGLTARFEADVLQLRPRLCILLIGCNDLWSIDEFIDPETGNYPEEAQQRYEDMLYGLIRGMLERVKQAGIPTWLGSLLPQGGRMPNYPLRNPLIARINKRLKKLAEEFDTKYIDYHSVMVQEDGVTVKDGVTREGCHPNHAGFELMRQVLQPMLDEFFGVRR